MKNIASACECNRRQNIAERSRLIYCCCFLFLSFCSFDDLFYHQMQRDWRREQGTTHERSAYLLRLIYYFASLSAALSHFPSPFLSLYLSFPPLPLPPSLYLSLSHLESTWRVQLCMCHDTT